MANLHLLFAFFTVAIATFSSEALNTATIHPKHLHTPPSSTKKHGHHAAAPSPATVEFAVPPVAFPGFYDTCLSKIPNQCGSEIYLGVFENGGVSAECCQNIVGLGRRCHKGIVRGAIKMKGLKKMDMVEIENRELQVWQDCVLITNLMKAGAHKSHQF